jgi:hypothetical protein
MEVVFRRLSERRYAIGLIRDGARDVGRDVAMRVAPGDTHVPHDLVHFVIEEQAELMLGILGQLSVGRCGVYLTVSHGGIEGRLGRGEQSYQWGCVLWFAGSALKVGA